MTGEDFEHLDQDPDQGKRSTDPKHWFYQSNCKIFTGFFIFFPVPCFYLHLRLTIIDYTKHNDIENVKNRVSFGEICTCHIYNDIQQLFVRICILYTHKKDHI